MLPKNHRLRKNKDFERVFEKGQSRGTKWLWLKKVKTEPQQPVRIGIVMPSKHFKKAVTRNKLKRQIRELLRKKLSDLKSGFDVVVLGKPGLEQKTFEQKRKILGRLLKKGKLFKK